MALQKSTCLITQVPGAQRAVHATAGLGAGSLQDQLLKLLAVGQIDWAGDFLLQTVASGAMLELLNLHLGPYAFLVPLTARKRRQVWFAVLAAMPAPHGEKERSELLSQLLLKSNKDLLASAYGSVPPGFEQALDRLGEQARDPNLYLDLFGILDATNHESIICEFRHLRDADVALIPLLPQMRGASKIAAVFSSDASFQRFLIVFAYITGGSPPDRVWKEIISGTHPYSILEREYRIRPFGHTPVIEDPDFEFISSLQTLEAVALKFRNCLFSRAQCAIQNSQQFYIWNASVAPVVICLQYDAIGWTLSEAKLAANGSLPANIKAALLGKLNTFGIRTWGKWDIVQYAYEDFDILDEEGAPL